MIILNGANIDGNLRLSDQTPNRLVIVNASLDVVSGNGVIASDNLRASVMGTTGSGSLVFANGPVFGGIVQMAGFQLGTSATPGHVLTANASGVGTYQAIAALPAGTSGQTLRHDGTNWIANSNLFNDGTIVSLGRAIITGTPATDQPVFGAQFLSEAGWTSTGWTGSWGAGWSNNASNVSPLSQSTPAVVATSYQIAYIVTGRTAGSFTLSFGEQSRGGISATGAFGPTATTTAGLVITPTSDFNGTIVLSIRAITAVSAPAITGRASNSTTVFEARFNTGFANTFLGISAGGRNTIGSLNSAVGASALNNNTTGSWNSAVGVSALNNTTTGTGNSAVGINALNNNTTGSWNSAVGVNALNNNTTANWNSAVGLSALHNNTTGSWNSAVGVNAGSFIADGITANTVTNNSIYLGVGTRALANNQTNQIVIGNDAIGAGSNTVTLGNVNIVTTVLRGNVTGSRFTSTVVTGTAPLTVASTTLVTNLNADLVRGQVPAVVATVNTLMQRDANGRAQVAAPSVAADIARLDTVTAHTSLTNNPHAVTVDQIGAAAAIHTHGNITTAGAIGITANLPIITGAGGALQVGSFGVAANTFCQGNDARLSNQRMPLAHSFLDTGLHFVSGLTVGHVLKATGNDTFTFAALVDTDIPNLHPNKIIQNVSNRFVGDSQIANWNTAHSWGNHAGLYSLLGHTHSESTTLVAGFMSAADKTKLDGIQANAINQSTADARYTQRANNLSDLSNVITARTNLGLGSMAIKSAGIAASEFRTNSENDSRFASLTHTHAEMHLALALGTPSNGLVLNAAQQILTLNLATTSLAGAMSVLDKSKLDGIANNANLYIHPTGFGNQPTNALTGAAVISRITVNTEGHVTGLSTRQLTINDLGAIGGSGLANRVAKFTANNQIGLSEIHEVGGFTGFGIPNPEQKVHVHEGNIRITGVGRGIFFPDGTSLTSALSNVGITGIFQMPAFVQGTFYMNNLHNNILGLTSFPIIANTVYLMPFVVAGNRNFSIDQIGINVVVAATAGTFSAVIGIYNDGGIGVPNQLVNQVTVTGLNSTGSKVSAITQTFEAGILYFLAIHSGCNCTIRALTANSQLSMGLSGSNDTIALNRIDRVLTWGTALPIAWNFNAAERNTNSALQVIFRAAPTTAPATPTGLSVTQNTGFDVSATWNTVPLATTYVLEHRINGGAITQVETSANSWWNNPPYVAGQLVEVRVAARNNIGISAFTAWATVTIVGAPDVPTGLAVIETGGGLIQATWNASLHATSYVVESNSTTFGTRYTEVSTTSWGGDGVYNIGDNVTVRVAARNNRGDSAFSTPVGVIITGESQAPV